MSTTTDDESNSCIFEWRIKNISHCWLKQEQRITSPDFTVDVLEGTKWSLWLYPMGINGKDNSDYVGLFLERKKDCFGPDAIEVLLKFAFLGKDGSFLKERLAGKRNFTRSSDWGFHQFENRQIIFINNKEDYLPDDTLTVQCTIWKGEKVVKPKRFYSETVFKVDRRYFEWKIDHLSNLKSDLRNEFDDDLIKFDLVLNEGLDLEKKLLLNINSCDKDIKYFSFKLSIIDSEGKSEDCGTHEYFLDDLKKGVSSTVLFTKKLMDNKSRYLPNDILSLDCEYVCSDGSVLYEVCVCGTISPKLKNEVFKSRKDCDIEKENSLINSAVLLNDLKLMYNDAICSDVVLRTPTQKFPTHKAILSARSPVFRKMFSNDMQEKNSGHVDIPDIEEDTIHRMLLYVYTDTLKDLNFNSVTKLYAAADKYEILDLKNRCSSFLKDNLCVENVCDVLVLADLHNDDILKTDVVDYILGHHKEIFCSQAWEDLMKTNIKLAADVMHKKFFRE